jgi:transaldolase
MDRLFALRAANVSLWTDGFEWHSAGTGLAGRVRRRAVTGVGPDTPAALARLLAPRHTAALERLAARGVRDPDAASRALALADARVAAASLRDAHRRTGGCDGLVELACPPRTASDPSEVIAFAEEVWHRADAPNLLVRVPSTEQGRLAFQELTYRGLNVSMGGILTAERAGGMAEAFLRALERRLNDGLSVHDVVSVIWVPIVGLDMRLDAQLPMQSPLRRTVAVAVAHSIYETVQRCFSGPRWSRLRRAGAQPQRAGFTDLVPHDPTAPAAAYAARLCLPGSILSAPLDTLKSLSREGGAGLGEVDETEVRWVLREATAAGARLRSLVAGLERDAERQTRSDHEAVLRSIGERLQRRSCCDSGGDPLRWTA